MMTMFSSSSQFSRSLTTTHYAGALMAFSTISLPKMMMMMMKIFLKMMIHEELEGY
jgi:hypothetical protein